MTNEELCALSLAAIDDANARVVLADAIEESGWRDKRIKGKFYGRGLWVWELPNGDGAIVRHGDRGGDHARAVAAVLLFGDWPTWKTWRERWPIVERCERRGVRWPAAVDPIGTLSAARDALRRRAYELDVWPVDYAVDDNPSVGEVRLLLPDHLGWGIASELVDAVRDVVPVGIRIFVDLRPSEYFVPRQE